MSAQMLQPFQSAPNAAACAGEGGREGWGELGVHNKPPPAVAALPGLPALGTGLLQRPLCQGIPQDGLLLDSLIPPHAEQGWARGACTWC